MLDKETVGSGEERVLFSTKGFIRFMGVGVFTLESPALLIPLRHSLSDRENFIKYFVIMLGIIYVLTLLISIPAYYVFSI